MSPAKNNALQHITLAFATVSQRDSHLDLARADLPCVAAGETGIDSSRSALATRRPSFGSR